MSSIGSGVSAENMTDMLKELMNVTTSEVSKGDIVIQVGKLTSVFVGQTSEGADH